MEVGALEGYTKSGVRQVIENLLAKKKETSRIAYERLAFSRARGRYVLFLCSPEYLGMADLFKLRRAILAQLPRWTG